MGNPENIEKSERVVPVATDRRLPSKAIALIGFFIAFLAIGAGVGIALIRLTDLLKKLNTFLFSKLKKVNRRTKVNH